MMMLGIGAAKAASTWLYEILQQSNAVTFPMGKESRYWTRANEASVSQHMKLYPNKDRRTGDIRGEYAFFSDENLQRLMSLYDDVRVVYILRHPVQRSCAHVSQVCETRLPMPLEDVPPEMAYALLKSDFFFKHNSYKANYEKWLGYVGRSRILLLPFDDVVHHPRAVLERLIRFLNLNPRIGQKITDEQLRTRHNHRSRIVPEYVQEQITAIYEEQGLIADMNELIGREVENI